MRYLTVGTAETIVGDIVGTVEAIDRWTHPGSWTSCIGGIAAQHADTRTKLRATE